MSRYLSITGGTRFSVNHFEYRRGALWAEDVSLSTIADELGTPTYVYSTATLTRHFKVLEQAFAGTSHLLCYSVKANSNLAILKLFASLGSGFDIVSGGELFRVQKAQGDLTKVVFAGVGKKESEMAEALKSGILMFNVESAEELDALDRVGRASGKAAPFALRVNPDVDAKTHRYIATGLKTSKFGVPFEEAVALYQKSRRMRGLHAVGLDCHIGSQLTETSPVKAALDKVADLFRVLQEKKIPLRYLDVGGGLGIPYQGESPPSPDAYAKTVKSSVEHTGAMLILEPGRVLVGNAGVLLTQVLYRKKSLQKTFVVVDAGMNDLIRPALYQAHHQILPVREKSRGTPELMDVVGPVCESSDVLAHQRKMVLPRSGDLWAVMSAGAYGMSMASTYNSRGRPAEVLVSGSRYRTIGRRETVEDLISLED